MKAFLKKANKIGIKISSVASGLHWQYSLSDSDKEIREYGIKIAKRMIEIASVLEADTVLLIPGLLTEESDYIEVYNQSVDVLRSLGKIAEKYGINIGLENGGMKFLHSPLEFNKFLEEIAYSNIGLYLDTANAMIDGYPQQWISILGKKIKGIHFKDFKSNVRLYPQAYTQLLQGDINWVEVMEKLKQMEYKGYIVAEIPSYRYFPLRIMDDISRNMDFILSLEERNE